MAEIAGCCDGAKAFSLWRAQDAVDDFALNQMTKKRNIFGGQEKIYEPRARAEQPNRRLSNSDSTGLSACFWFRQLITAHDITHGRHVKAEKH